MGDYGHELAFGVFLTPGSQEPERAVRLAQLAEEAGLDLVTFQDHPYQPALLDTWTLMSYVAARTERIRLAGNVLNLPLRSPAVLARSVASLDLLSGGRIELGLGAGGFWDAIEAMGGRRLAPGQAVDALAEAIELIREVWNTGTRGGVRFGGRYYQVAGTKRGPAPAHRVDVWVGAYRPRMLNLVGRLADGWLPSLSYLQPGQLAEGNALIDKAAAEAGRSPGAVRRLLNVGGELSASATAQAVAGGAGPLTGPAGHWAGQLTELALSQGVSTFILASDDPATIAAFAAEVAPAVREQVEAARSGSGPGSASGSGYAAPASATRLTGHQLWDETARPTRPALPDASYTRAGQAASAELVQVHDMLRRELSTIRELIVQVRDGAVSAAQARSELNQMTMRQNNWTMGAYCQSYCRLVTAHHGAEDAAVFPYLRSRDSGLGPVLDRLQQEHRVIHEVLDAVDQALVSYIGPADAASGDISGLQHAADVLTDTLLSHLAYEERELLDPLARYGFYGSGQQ
jgi:alkanesulfonate monooxygenase SsuD/methylene tetrahydromethanopterin reductase-like flavin-dependent oxidoreductase (luciferase family)